MKIIIFFVYAIGVFSPVSLLADSLLIDNFESGSIPIVRPSLSDHNQYLWAHVPADKDGNPRPGEATLTQEDSFSLENINSLFSIKTTLESEGNMFLHYYPYDDDLYEWRYIREQLVINGANSQGGWKLNHYNRLRFWIKASDFQIGEDPKKTNFHFGTYVRETGAPRRNAESGNGHYYHYYQISPSNSWHQVIVDFHPSHQRGASGNFEHGLKEFPFPSTDPSLNYFDLMTRFYFDFKPGLSSYPSSHYIDQIELYYDPNLENISQVYSINGVYVPDENKFLIGWKRSKDEDDLAHEVRYSFSDIHNTGWDSATALPNNLITPAGQGGYNGMEYSTTSIDASSESEVFFAIKPVNSSLFRQIRIPVRSKPSAPSNLNVSSG
jgi:hypothetical protein